MAQRPYGQPTRRDMFTHTYKNGAAFNRHAAQMRQAGWHIGPHTERGKKATVTWYRDAPVSVAPDAFLPPPPKGGLGALGIIGIVVGAVVVLAIVGAAIGASNATAKNNAAATRAITYSDSDYATVDVRALKKNPETYKDRRIQVQGEVFNIRERGGSTFLQMYVPIPGGTQFEREPVVVNYNGTLPSVYEKTTITVFGVGDGTGSGTNAFGATNTQPAIRADRVVVTQ